MKAGYIPRHSAILALTRLDVELLCCSRQHATTMPSSRPYTNINIDIV